MTPTAPADPAGSSAARDFSLRIRDRGEVLLIELGGPLSGAPVEILRMYLVRTLATLAVPALVVDLSGLTGLDAAGLEVLRSATRDARAAGGRLVVTGGLPLLDAADTAGLDLLPTIEAGLAALDPPGTP
ncbi:STAS domain-containing protein [Nonomuraea wenchangensis]|uniref:Anti-anti-sigma factor n=1 Tax=Nonomuraea wenchangensis TaxID=568860 RepID=A0A1I0K629_9ACTN|nr:STAS domain-containing protein [Nonomuraea wenchangensis]SEU19259.1 anti-anti-sigma factor [Nonomuraea wenchangensis]